MSEGRFLLVFSLLPTDWISRGATPETVKKAFEIIVTDPKVKSIFINIFGGTFFPRFPTHT
jgi:succinyl-CoA synthetase beta subunit